MAEEAQNETRAPEDQERETRSANRGPVMPLDMMVARFQLWVEDLEKQRAEAREQARIPDDIPRYVTRSS